MSAGHREYAPRAHPNTNPENHWQYNEFEGKLKCLKREAAKS